MCVMILFWISTRHTGLQYITHLAEECRICHLKRDDSKLIRKFPKKQQQFYLIHIDLYTNLLCLLLPQEPLLWDVILQDKTKKALLTQAYYVIIALAQ